MPSVLVVASDEDLREILVEGLRIEGWTSLAAATAGEAINKASGVRVDVVLTDVILSSGDGVGLEMAFRRRGELCHVPFVFMTGFAPYVDQLGPGRALLKPFRLEEACRLLRATLAASAAGIRRGVPASGARLVRANPVQAPRDRAAAELSDLRTLPS
jgi:CheY-like chemotaxis protein